MVRPYAYTRIEVNPISGVGIRVVGSYFRASNFDEAQRMLKRDFGFDARLLEPGEKIDGYQVVGNKKYGTYPEKIHETRRQVHVRETQSNRARTA